MDSAELHETDIKKTDNSIENQQKHHEQVIGEDTKNSIMKLKQRKNLIVGKLTKTQHKLQQAKNDMECSGKDSNKNNLKVSHTLNMLRSTIPAAPEVPILTTRPPKTQSENKDLKSKKHLEAIIEGYEQLILKLITNNKKMLSVFGNAAQKIYVLKNLPLFEDIEKERKKQKHAKSRSKQNKEAIEPGPYNMLEDDVDVQLRPQTKKNQRTPTEKFCKYINSILVETIGAEQKEKLEKYKCLPQHIDDLEAYSNALVQAGYGEIVEQELRINGKNNHQAFISMPNNIDGSEMDGYISTAVARRYAFDGDIVRAFVTNSYKLASESIGLKDKIELDSSNETTGSSDTSMNKVSGEDSRPKAYVIKIIKQTELREVVGSVTFAQTTLINNKPHYKVRPYDTKIPMVFIPEEICREEINNIAKEDICGMLYVARILDVDVNGYCLGELVQPVGKVGSLQPEIEAILLNNGLKDLKPYEQKYNDMFEGPMPPPSDEELKCREDLSKKCVFTIDPLTAKDLDDAVSVEQLNNKEFEIGVHISDVSYYLQENSELDNLVKLRATSVYLVDRVIHMLPAPLCFRCSLLPGKEKFAFSVFWKWHVEKEELSSPRFTKSIINSCSQLAYEHVQKIIDNPNEDIEHEDLPDILNEWTPNDIKYQVLLLHQIGQKLKAKRYENGSLSLNNPKLRFQLDPKSGEPLSFEIEDRREAQFLIEELMLLANQAVAKFIYNYFPDKSILRNHAPPLAKPLKALQERLKKLGLNFDIMSSKSISASIQRLCQDSNDPEGVEAVLNTLLTKPMARAKYFCTDGKASEAVLWHYALSVPIYTHFTSPIRRYPDVMVHRLLAAALNYCPTPKRTTEELHQLTKIMNDQKLNAKKAGDDSINLFFKRYLKAKKFVTFNAVVTEITENAVNVVTMESGHCIPVAYNLQENVSVTKNVPDSVLIRKRFENLPVKKLQLFSRVKINLTLQNEKLFATLNIFDEADNDHAIGDCKETSKEYEVSTNNYDEKNKSVSTGARKKTKSRKKTEDYLAFYAVKN